MESHQLPSLLSDQFCKDCNASEKCQTDSPRQRTLLFTEQIQNRVAVQIFTCGFTKCLGNGI